MNFPEKRPGKQPQKTKEMKDYRGITRRSISQRKIEIVQRQATGRLSLLAVAHCVSSIGRTEETKLTVPIQKWEIFKSREKRLPWRLAQIHEFRGYRGAKRSSVKQWFQIRNGFIYLRETKTHEGRNIPVNKALSELFREIRQEQGLKSEYVFRFTKGEHALKGKKAVRKCKIPAPMPEMIGNVSRAFSNAVKRAGIEDFRFHDLRHTFASHMVMRGASLKQVQEILGHKTMTMTLRYPHLSQEYKKEAVNLLDGLTASNSPSDAACRKMSHFEPHNVSAIG